MPVRILSRIFSKITRQIRLTDEDQILAAQRLSQYVSLATSARFLMVKLLAM